MGQPCEVFMESSLKDEMQSTLEVLTEECHFSFWREVTLTRGEKIPVVLQYHVPGQSSLSRVQAFPLLLRGFDGHTSGKESFLTLFSFSSRPFSGEVNPECV